MRVPDAVVVGSGPNGLAAAVTMARAGLAVRVLERAEVAGGAAGTVHATVPGMPHDVGAAVFGFARGSPVLRSWPLARHGLRWVHPRVPLAHPLPGGEAVRMHASVAATAAELGTDGDAWTALTGPATMAWPHLARDVLAPMLHLPRAPLAFARFGMRGLPPAAWTARLLPGGRARALWAGLAAHTALPLSAAGTSAQALVLAALGQRVGWPFPEGGAGRVAQALQGYLESLGGEVVTGTEVRSLADLPPARAVLLDVTPAMFLRVAEGSVPSGYARALSRFRRGEGVVKLDLAVEGGIPWTDPTCAEAGTIHLGGPYERIAAAEAEVAAGRVPEAPYVLLAQPGRVDGTRRREGLEPVWAYAHLPRGSAGDASAVATLAGRILAQIERVAPGTAARTRAVTTWGPPELAARNPNLAGGDITGGATTLRQLLARPVLTPAPYATPLAGIYLCSSSTPPGPGVHGMSGFQAARLALRREFGLEVPWPEAVEDEAANEG